MSGPAGLIAWDRAPLKRNTFNICPKRNLRRIENHFDRFRVSRPARTYFFILAVFAAPPE